MAELGPEPKSGEARWRHLLDSRSGRRDGLPTVLRRNPELQPSLADEEKFKALLLHRYDIDAAPDDVQDCLFDLRWRGKMLFGKLFTPEQGDPPFVSDRIVFDFIDRASFSACVRPSMASPGVYHVGINVGLIARLYRSAYALMSMRDVFPGIGNANEESASDAEVAERLFEPAGRNLRLLDRGICPLPSAAFADLRPKSVERHFFAHALVAVGLQWFYYHEFHHVWAGHLRLFQALKPDFVREVAFAESEEIADALGVQGDTILESPEHRRLRRLVEYDADKRAARRMVHPLTEDLVMLNAVKLDEAEKAQLPAAWALMLGTLFLLLNPRPSEDITAENREYPHPEVRFWGAFSAFTDNLSARDTASFHEEIARSMKLLNRLWKAGAGGGDCYSLSRKRTEEVVNEANRLSAAVNQELYPRLFPYDMDQLLAARMAKLSGGAQ